MIDIEATLSDLLRADPGIQGRVTDRVWITMPAKPKFPAILIRRIGGAGQVSFQGGVHSDRADIDLHCYGGSRVEALSLAQNALSVLAAAIHALTVVPFTMQRIPDNSMPQDNGRDRERYILSLRASGSTRP